MARPPPDDATRVDLLRLTAEPGLPPVPPPRLEGLTLEVVAPPQPTREALLLRFSARLREAGTQRERAAGEAVAPGDDVLVDLSLYERGALAPGGILLGRWLPPGADPLLTGLREALDGRPVPGSFEVPVRGASDAPFAEWRDRPFRAAVHLRAAVEVTPLAPGGPLGALGGQTEEEVMEGLAQELAAEREALLAQRVQSAALEAVAAQVEASVPEAVVDEELTRRWFSEQDEALVALGFSAQEREEAVASLRAAPSARAAARTRVKAALGLAALVRTGAVTLTHEGVGRMVQALTSRTGLTDAQLRELLKQDLKLQAHAQELALYAAALEHVLAKVQVRVREP